MKSYRIASLLTIILALAVPAFAATAADNWENSCASCHGADGKGQTKVGKKLKLKDYTDASALATFTDEQLAKAIVEGVKNEAGKEVMKPSPDLSSDEVAELVKYVRDMAKK